MNEPTPAAPTSAPLAQSKYQVRFEWGAEGAADIAEGAHVAVLVDVLQDAAAAAAPWNAQRGAAVADAFPTAAVVGASFTNRRAVAQWILDHQVAAGERVMIAIVALGEPRADGSTRFAVEDYLAAGALIDALAELGIDYCSPEAAAASAAYTGLARATSHLVSASGSGQTLIAAGLREAVAAQTVLDSSTEVSLRG
ncbi:2-phosphosulfolactate phosphatase [Compostimonas suwonensis]|uniref:Probable 2-phosphosulfolactate phosphatase n=1 Tax=Compostimonas suwonensis TaxID=1048394 RepID=A0A2M9C572_9MICO|nr:2-phosphosulfolactate phosphatase [Compostimonas suwonensis]PJJ65675.1 2-phosphosulfolactate phosphatase [Compostimonas suwonensis]